MYSVIVSFGVIASLSFPISIVKGIFGAYATPSFPPLYGTGSKLGDSLLSQHYHDTTRPNTASIGPVVIALTFKVWLVRIHLLTTSLRGRNGSLQRFNCLRCKLAKVALFILMSYILWWPRTANKKFAYFCGINFSFTEK